MTRRHRHRSRRHRGSSAAPDPRPADGLSPNPKQLDRLAPGAAVTAIGAGLREPELIVESPERVAERKARDLRDGVKKADRRGLLYLMIGLVVALLVIGILAFIDARASIP